jgi:hypothetical protein
MSFKRKIPSLMKKKKNLGKKKQNKKSLNIAPVSIWCILGRSAI